MHDACWKWIETKTIWGWSSNPQPKIVLELQVHFIYGIFWILFMANMAFKNKMRSGYRCMFGCHLEVWTKNFLYRFIKGQTHFSNACVIILTKFQSSMTIYIITEMFGWKVDKLKVHQDDNFCKSIHQKKLPQWHKYHMTLTTILV